VLVIFGGAFLITPGFITAGNFANILATMLPLLLAALGQTVVLIAGGIDLSTSAIIGLTSIVGAMVMNDDTGWLARSPLAAIAGVAAMVGLGAMVGAFNGLGVTRGRMPPFMVTLASMMGFSGLALATSIAALVNGTLCVVMLRAQLDGIGGRALIVSLLKVAAASAAMSAVVVTVNRLLYEFTSEGERVSEIGVGVPYALTGLGTIGQAKAIAVRGSTGEVFVADAASDTLKVYGPREVFPDVTTGSASSIQRDSVEVGGQDILPGS